MSEVDARGFGNKLFISPSILYVLGGFRSVKPVP